MDERLAEQMISLLKEIRNELGEIKSELSTISLYTGATDTNTSDIETKLDQLIEVVKSS